MNLVFSSFKKANEAKQCWPLERYTGDSGLILVHMYRKDKTFSHAISN
jgi:hypothetical protein